MDSRWPAVADLDKIKQKSNRSVTERGSSGGDWSVGRCGREGAEELSHALIDDHRWLDYEGGRIWLWMTGFGPENTPENHTVVRGGGGACSHAPRNLTASRPPSFFFLRPFILQLASNSRRFLYPSSLPHSQGMASFSQEMWVVGA